MKIGNIEIQDYLNQAEENIDEMYNQILEQVKVCPNYLDGTWLDGNATWLEVKEMLKYRKNIIDWLPMEKDAAVLELMSGCGSISGGLASKVKNLTCLEVSKTKSFINAYRNNQQKNMSIYISLFREFL